ncbi:MAG: ABC transporter permease subunit [Mesorhizobium sp.]|uniref:ABC transporter permease n=1 Tax=unclassified Mesorhizobium TaxID=325217 RepID=UPI000F74C81B|nr:MULTISPECIES: ABC transporter permease [unclassified Mesorhizobium]AZO47032.1 ABC transporter permease [Mesorhizobium sp. M4B.F.Ca.ET.058.02.1.1]RUX41736.1 ABC transporter permease subunit [Mesorhizobium sp. M4A.F.Ca.ET.050.02.1.1]RVC44216.1 ABC transporter permease subunit [Mesorhizobium sp. M4A.F.Ca.ET.090.04.2.1]RVC79394.1 ABC transporter permease subunit [Mesorhizobium sp. M4A.F.Ca.ET.022.05.2.1]RVD36242.1 ABC transporter permease subunit [Mesorhizobium sp. M4A.F.Ca.ET.020.02.1.1]
MSVAADAKSVVERPPPRARGWPRSRIVGYVLIGLWIAAGGGIVAYLALAWNSELFAKYGPSYLQGLGVTLSLVGISIVLGAILSLPVAYARMSKNRILSGLAYCYVYFFRGTPLLVQTFLVYYGVGSFKPQLEMVGLWGFFREAFNCGVFAFALNTAAYQAEILRGAIESVPKGQWEGAASLGLHKLQTLWKIILPQAMVVALRPYGNELILMIKASAIVAIITVYDLMGMAKLTYSRTFDIQAYIWVAVVYLVMVEVLRHAIEWIERRITIHLKR